jgi:hypothetical protein
VNLIWGVPRSSKLCVKQPTVLTVLTQTPPPKGLTANLRSVGEALAAWAQSDGPDLGVALDAAGLQRAGNADAADAGIPRIWVCPRLGLSAVAHQASPHARTGAQHVAGQHGEAPCNEVGGTRLKQPVSNSISIRLQLLLPDAFMLTKFEWRSISRPPRRLPSSCQRRSYRAPTPAVGRGAFLRLDRRVSRSVVAHPGFAKFGISRHSVENTVKCCRSIEVWRR